VSPQPPATPVNISVTTPPEEAQLDWYREDPLANDHHHHWHVVYPRGIPRPGRPPPRRTQPRQGELFLYMHQQMLARYDTERRIAGLGPCEPLTDYRAPIPEGYELQGYGPRPAGRTPTDLEAVGEVEGGFAEVEAALADQAIEFADGSRKVPLEANVLGCELESSAWYPEPGAGMAPLQYRNFHGNGHGMISSASDETGFGGPMAYVETAIRDPVFYRWHRHIDDFSATHQETLDPHDFGEFAADVAFRKDDPFNSSDVALCLAEQIDEAETPGFDFADWGRKNLGLDLELDGPTTDELLTEFVRSDITLAAIPGMSKEEEELIPDEWLRGVVHLTHKPFVYFIRVESKAPQPQDVTVRIFLAHHSDAENRRMWIELDKFKETLEPGANLIARPDARSSVVRRKGLTVPGAEPTPSTPGDVWCDCGWPYTLLLPSGESTPEGTQFKLMVAVTDWSKDHLGEPETCGSMSFCGARSEYPDARSMGYPFDRPIPGYIRSAIGHQPSMAMRDLNIRCTTVRPG
jgi:tyrosinase